MTQLTEIRWHGRGGQGAKTAALLLADVAFTTGMYIQGFPEYGPERMGAPITAYNRLSDAPILIHSNIYEPDYVAVVDETLLTAVDVTAGLRPDGAIIINTARTPAEILADLGGYKGRVYTLDAKKVALTASGKNIPNTPMLAAVVRASGVIEEKVFLANMKASFDHKFATKPEVIAGNMRALSLALEEVRCYEGAK